MIKNVLFKNETREMSLEQVIERFQKQVRYFARRMESEIYGSELTREDYEQIGYVALVEAFMAYDEQYIFSSYFDTKLKGERTKIISKLNTQKRKCESTLMSLDESTGSEGEDLVLGDVIGTLDNAIEELAGDDLVGSIFNDLNEEEKLMYLHIIERGMRPIEYAQMINVSKQSLNYKLRKLKEKLLTLYNVHSPKFN